MITYPKALLIVLGIVGLPANAIACATAESPGQAQEAERCTAPEPPHGRVSANQLDAIMEWLADRFDLPRSAERPVIVFESPARFGRMRQGGSATQRDATRQNESGLQSEQGNILALYNDARRMIVLPDDWTATDAGLSVLVHEMVHHLQNMAGMKYNCAGEREKLAYRAQSAWLAQSGKSLESEFKLDGLSLIVLSNCV